MNKKNLALGYDIAQLKSVEECRRVMERAKKHQFDDIYAAVFRRMCEIAGNEHDDPNDPLVKDFYETLGAYEQLLSEKNGRNQPAGRTRQKIANKGVHQSLIEWTRGKVETNGFKLLVEAGLPEYTGEYLVVKYGTRFPGDVVALAEGRLLKNGVALPDVMTKSRRS